jgi:hypothetical protein
VKAKTLLLTLLIFGVYLLHQDFWNWRKVEPLVFGFLPVGLAYQAGYSVLAAILMALLVKVAWPRHLENVTGSDSSPDVGKKEDHR